MVSRLVVAVFAVTAAVSANDGPRVIAKINPQSVEGRRLEARRFPAPGTPQKQEHPLDRQEWQIQCGKRNKSTVEVDVVILEDLEYELVSPRTEINPKRLCKALIDSGNASSCEVDRLIQLQSISSDPLFKEQPYLYDINLPGAWIIGGSKANSDVIVAIIDTGLDLSHKDLKSRLWTNPLEIPGNGIDDDNNGYVDDVHGWDMHNDDSDPQDDHGHGTSIGGIIGADTNNSYGISGMARAKLMALKVMNDKKQGFISSSLWALDYAVRMGARVSSNSWGCYGCNMDAFHVQVDKALQRGHLFVTAAGNSGGNNDEKPMMPCSSHQPNVLCVGSVEGKLAYPERSAFSNYGASTVHVMAPGEHIQSTEPTALVPSGFGPRSGTSLSTPIVVGLAALLWSIRPDLDYKAVLAAITSTVDVIPALHGTCTTGGRINACKAVHSILAHPVGESTAACEWARSLIPVPAQYHVGDVADVADEKKADLTIVGLSKEVEENATTANGLVAGVMVILLLCCLLAGAYYLHCRKPNKEQRSAGHLPPDEEDSEATQILSKKVSDPKLKQPQVQAQPLHYVQLSPQQLLASQQLLAWQQQQNLRWMQYQNLQFIRQQQLPPQQRQLQFTTGPQSPRLVVPAARQLAPPRPAVQQRQPAQLQQWSPGHYGQPPTAATQQQKVYLPPPEQSFSSAQLTQPPTNSRCAASAAPPTDSEPAVLQQGAFHPLPPASAVHKGAAQTQAGSTVPKAPQARQAPNIAVAQQRPRGRSVSPQAAPAASGETPPRALLVQRPPA